jgi:hypothetical protein
MSASYTPPTIPRHHAWRERIETMIMTDKTKPDPTAAPSGENPAPDQVPDWLGNRLRRMFTEVMHEPVPDDFKALLKQLEDKERGG